MVECDSEEVKEIVKRINANLEENRKLYEELRRHSKVHSCNINL